MGLRKHLNDFEKGQIIALDHGKLSLRDIADIVHRDPSTVQRFLKRRTKRVTKEKPRNGTKLTSFMKRRLLRAASNGLMSARELKGSLNLHVTARRIQQILHETPHLKYRKVQKAPALTPQHRNAREEWARRFVTRGNPFWVKVIFSDEKTFNLDGPDGLEYYWHDLRKEQQRFSTRQAGGGSVMLWGCITFYGVGILFVTEGKQDAIKYCKTLEDGLLPVSAEVFGEQRIWVFQQDNAPIRTAKVTRQWLAQRSIRTLRWPARSPDLNIIENVWGYMARKVYSHNRSFENVEELKQKLVDVWTSIDPDYLFTLYRSMHSRLLNVIEKKGDATKY